MNEVNLVYLFLHTVPQETSPTITPSPGTFINIQHYLQTCMFNHLTSANWDTWHKKELLNREYDFHLDCDALNLKLKCLILGTAYITSLWACWARWREAKSPLSRTIYNSPLSCLLGHLNEASFFFCCYSRRLLCSLERQELLMVKKLKIEHKQAFGATSIYFKKKFVFLFHLETFCGSHHSSIWYKNPF